MLRFILLTLVVLLFVPGTVIAVMLILQINGITVNVQSWLNSAFALTIVAELYGIVKIM
ncbi:TPA: hypothetical protein KOR75_001083 [Clostridioides difficile]|nr:hypothetical protein [Clostridioides difficile]